MNICEKSAQVTKEHKVYKELFQAEFEQYIAINEFSLPNIIEEEKIDLRKPKMKDDGDVVSVDFFGNK